jgi:hypothetical protein
MLEELWKGVYVAYGAGVGRCGRDDDVLERRQGRRSQKLICCLALREVN